MKMNEARKKEVKAIIRKLMVLRDHLENIKDEEQESFDNLPDGFKESERGRVREAEVEEAVDALDEALDAFDELADQLDEIIG